MSIQFRPAIFAAAFVFVIGGAAAANARTLLAGSGHIYGGGPNTNVGESYGRINNSLASGSTFVQWEIPLPNDHEGSSGMLTGSFIGNGNGNSTMATQCQFTAVHTNETVFNTSGLAGPWTTTASLTTIPQINIAQGDGFQAFCNIPPSGRVSLVSYTF